MNQERMILQGQLVEAERTLKATEREADGQVLLLRMRALPTLALRQIKTEEIVSAATALHRLALEATKLQTRIAEIREALGLEA